LRSLSKNALVDITVDFAEGTDIYWARQQVAERFANVKGDLPANVSGGLAPISTPLSELYMFTLEGPLSLAEKRTLLDWTVRPQLRAIPGVADVNSLGGRVATFAVNPDPASLAARGVTYDELRTALEKHPQRRRRARQRRRGNLGGARQRRHRFAGGFAAHRHQTVGAWSSLSATSRAWNWVR
jgi:Putative silver efflux pump